MFHRGTLKQYNDFETYVSAIRHYPIISKNVATGQPAPDKTLTTDYAKNTKVQLGKDDDYIWRCSEYQDKALPVLTKQEAIKEGFIEGDL